MDHSSPYNPLSFDAYELHNNPSFFSDPNEFQYHYDFDRNPFGVELNENQFLDEPWVNQSNFNDSNTEHRFDETNYGGPDTCIVTSEFANNQFNTHSQNFETMAQNSISSSPYPIPNFTSGNNWHSELTARTATDLFSSPPPPMPPSVGHDTQMPLGRKINKAAKISLPSSNISGIQSSDGTNITIEERDNILKLKSYLSSSGRPINDYGLLAELLVLNYGDILEFNNETEMKIFITSLFQESDDYFSSLNLSEERAAQLLECRNQIKTVVNREDLKIFIME